MKVFLKISIIVLVGFTLLVADKDERISLGIPHFTVVAPAYPTISEDSVRLDVIIKIPHDAVQFLKVENGFEAKCEVSISIQNDNGDQIAEEIWRQSLFAEKFSNTVSPKLYRLEKRSFFIPLSKYKVIVDLTDLDTHKSGKQKIIIDVTRFSEKVALSDLLIVNKDTIVNKYFPAGLPLIPARISDTDTNLYLYYEARVLPGKYLLKTKELSVKDEVLNKETFEKLAEAEIIRDQLILRKNSDARNKYKIEVELSQNEITSSAEVVVEVKWLGLTTHISNLDDAIEQLKYIAERDVLKEMLNAKSQKKEELFKKFWKGVDPTPETVENELMNEFYRRVRYANEKFSSFQDGWKTDMGMIFILFGPPDDIEINLFARDRKSYQKWEYYYIHRTFIFVDHLGFGDYELIEPYNSPYGSSLRYRY